MVTVPWKMQARLSNLVATARKFCGALIVRSTAVLRL